jgi:hypothetical protein
MAQFINPLRLRGLSLAPFGLLHLFACGAGDATATSQEPSTSAPSDPACTGDECAKATDGGAVMVAVSVLTSDESTLYVGAYPDLPAGDLDTSGMIEAGASAGAAAFNGYVYVWDGESGRYTRYSVDDELALVPGPVVSFTALGVTGPVMTSFVSPTRAYSLTTENMQIVAWNPTEMVILGSISTAALEDPDYVRVEYGEPTVFGEYVAWPILWYDYDNLRFKPEQGVALAKIGSLEPAIVVRDGRCGAGWSLFSDPAGDLYVTGNAYFGFAHFFGEAAPSFPSDCLLRITAGTTEFDRDFVLDLDAATGSPAVYHTWHVSEHTLLAAVWDPATDPAALPSSDDFWNAPLLRAVVDIDAGTSTPVVGMPQSAVWSTVNYRLDGTLYVPQSEGTLNPDGTPGPVRSTLYRVKDANAEPALTIDGDVWSIGRIR